MSARLTSLARTGGVDDAGADAEEAGVATFVSDPDADVDTDDAEEGGGAACGGPGAVPS
jgi:hypothetical protein